MKLRIRKNTDPNQFEDYILSLFENIGITAYHDHGNMDYFDLELHDKQNKYHMEFDVVAVIGKIGIIIEAKKLKEKNPKAIKKFLEHAHEFEKSPKTIEEKIKLLRGIPKNKREEYNHVEEWRFIFASDQDEILEKKLDENYVKNKKNFTVFNKHHLRYIQFLGDTLGDNGKYEVLKKLNISFKDAGIKNGKEFYDALKIPRRKISKTMKVADLFLFGARVSDLLKISRVDRYGSLENWTPEAGKNSYQRILTKQKLLNIQEFIKIGKDQTSFPNTITTIFNEDPKWKNGKIELGIKPGVLDIIDGQHRLFGFAKIDSKKINLEKQSYQSQGFSFKIHQKVKL